MILCDCFLRIESIIIKGKNLGTLRWRRIICEGNRPSGRDGHSAAVFGDKMYIFGGYEDSLERFCFIKIFVDLIDLLDFRINFRKFI